MRNLKLLGNFGESVACDYLSNEGYLLIERNYCLWGGEIDIITFRDGIYVFVEVKSRENEDDIFLEQLISLKKKRTLVRTCRLWLLKQGLMDKEWRIDFIGLIIREGKVKDLRHIENAIY